MASEKPSRHSLSGYFPNVLIALAVGGALFVLFAFIWARSATRPRRVVYRLDCGARVPAPGDLHRAAAVVAARLKELRGEFRLGASSARPLHPDRVEVLVASRGDPGRALAWATMQGRIEFRLVHPTQDAAGAAPPQDVPSDYEIKTYRQKRYLLSKPGELQTVERRYALGRRPALLVRSLAGVEIHTVGVKKLAVLTFRFGPEDARALADLTALQAGRQMAMLIDGEMFFPPKRIEKALTGGAIQVQGYFYLPMLRRLVRMLRCGVLPGRLVRVSGPQARAVPAGAAHRSGRRSGLEQKRSRSFAASRPVQTRPASSG